MIPLAPWYETIVREDNLVNAKYSLSIPVDMLVRDIF